MRRILIHFAKEISEIPSLNWGTPVIIADQEAKHLTHVLRLESGEKIFAITPYGYAIEGLLHIEKRQAFFIANSNKIDGSVNKIFPTNNETPPLFAAIAIQKGEAMEWTVEKLTELGVKEIFPIFCERSIVKNKVELNEKLHERWQKIADQSLKQCERINRLLVHSPLTFLQWIEKIKTLQGPLLLLDEEKRTNQQSLTINQWFSKYDSGVEKNLTLQFAIGPEGGWTNNEKQLILQNKNTIGISLGPLVLRAETAAIAVAALCSQQMRSTLDTEPSTGSNRI